MTVVDMQTLLTYSAHYAHCAPGSLLCSKQCQHFVERPTQKARVSTLNGFF